MRGFVTLAVVLLLSTGSVLGDTDYESFMSSLSDNWQNEFSDLRYQVEQLQKTDPQKYSQLAASLGLKSGTKISIPSQYSPEWASKFVQAAGLYTPPPATVADDPMSVATPTSNLIHSIGEITQQQSTATADSDDDDGSSDSLDDDDADDSNSSKNKKPAAGGKSSNDDGSSGDGGGTSGLDATDDENTDTQYGNPVVGNFNGGNTPIVPSGQGYSAATSVRPLALHVLGTMTLSMWLTILTF
ncbi:hypothetical protein IWW50_002829 [Coemansia erecta]|nr:hypothetical protein GGF43_002889 [Coemansia sp. RSA 2618]KAJ2825478.1 hypothetical protein IWW50_002829 [Coemansia erecta]